MGNGEYVKETLPATKKQKNTKDTNGSSTKKDNVPLGGGLQLAPFKNVY